MEIRGDSEGAGNKGEERFDLGMIRERGVGREDMIPMEMEF